MRYYLTCYENNKGESYFRCYNKNELSYIINLTDSFINTHKVDNDIVISIYRKSQKHKLYKECDFRLLRGNTFMYSFNKSPFKELIFNELYEK